MKQRSSWLLLVAALPALVLGIHPIDSTDLWFQLATGDWIVAHRALPHVDPFGTLPPDRPWLVHDWLATVGLQVLYRIGGATALVLGTTMLLMGSLLVPSLMARRRGATLGPYALALLVATSIAYERFFVRPEAWTLLCASLFTAVLANGGPCKRRGVIGLVATQAAWTNLHAGFLLGPLLSAVATVADLVAKRVARRAWMLPVVLVAACCVTPYGAGLLLNALRAGREVGGAELRRGIVEWQPTFAFGVRGDFVLMIFVGSLVGIAIVAWVCRRQIRIRELLLLLSVTGLSLTARRHLAVYAVTALPLAAGWVERWWSARPAPGRTVGRLAARALPGLTALVAVVFTATVVRGGFYRFAGPPRSFDLGFAPDDAPMGAADFVAQHALPGPLFNNIAAGGALVWRLRGEPAALIDGRLLDTSLYPAYRRCLESMPAFDAFAAAHGIRTVVLGLQPFQPAQLFVHLATDSTWSLVFFDAAGAVFTRDSLRAERRIMPVRLDMALAPATERRPDRWWHECDPGEAGRRGEMLLRLGYPAAARFDLQQALERCPERWEIGLRLSTALIATGHHAEARPLVEHALEHDAANADAWVNAGLLCQAAGQSDCARDAWERAAALAPTDPRPGRYLRSLAP